MRWKYKYEALNAAKVYIDTGTYKNGKVKTNVFFVCAECARQKRKKDYHARHEVQVDHIVEIAGETGFTDWNAFIPALLCPAVDLQILCKPCHKTKTDAYLDRRGLLKPKKDKKSNKKA
jgi:5-methylcytosine-specific restriction endonuclease McrA